MNQVCNESENDFSGTVENWEDRVFINADHFRLHRYYGHSGRDDAETRDFNTALKWARESLGEGKRVLIYAVTASGRATCLTTGRWDHYAALWAAR